MGFDAKLHVLIVLLLVLIDLLSESLLILLSKVLLVPLVGDLSCLNGLVYLEALVLDHLVIEAPLA